MIAYNSVTVRFFQDYVKSHSEALQQYKDKHEVIPLKMIKLSILAWLQRMIYTFTGLASVSTCMAFGTVKSLGSWFVHKSTSCTTTISWENCKRSIARKNGVSGS